MTNRDRGFNQLAFLIITNMIFLHVLDAPIEVIMGLWLVGSLAAFMYSVTKEES